MTVEGLECDGCGAPLPTPARGETTVGCTYCGRQLAIVSGRTEVRGTAGADSLSDRLLRGYPGEPMGRGERFDVAAMEARDWQCWERGLWPVAARASSSYGGGWRPESLVGPPRVYPLSGDRSGAWAPGTRKSHVEWVEAEYEAGPPIEAIRIFETCAPGATYAVTVGDEKGDELVFGKRAEAAGTEAQVLEVRLDPPREVRSVRAYVNNDIGSSFSEIDTIGLVAAEPLPVERRVRAEGGERKSTLKKVGCAIGAVVAAVVAVVAITASSGPGEPKQAPPAPGARVEGSSVRAWNVDVARVASMGTPWAESIVEVSSVYTGQNRDGYSGQEALGRPNVYPRHLDARSAWAPEWEDQGPEWITVAFATPVSASAVLIVETYNPGAVLRVDDLSQGQPAVLWEGETDPSGTSRILRIDLPEPRTIGVLRVVLDTRRVAGWNEIDAVGLLPSD